MNSTRQFLDFLCVSRCRVSARQPSSKSDSVSAIILARKGVITALHIPRVGICSFVIDITEYGNWGSRIS